MDLLKRLGSGVRPPGVGASERAARVEGRSFEELLHEAASGEGLGGRPLREERGVGLNDVQRARLTRAADEATRLGATRLFAEVDGEAHIVDLEQRIVARAPSDGARAGAQDEAVHEGIDAAVVIRTSSMARDEADNAGDVGAAPRVLGDGPPGAARGAPIGNASLLDALGAGAGEVEQGGSERAPRGDA
jgi:hypothetical protein